jgi:hypothetical protein
MIRLQIDRSYLICFHVDCQRKNLEVRVNNITVIIHRTQFWARTFAIIKNPKYTSLHLVPHQKYIKD